MDYQKIKQGLQTALEASSLLNRYIQEAKLWELQGAAQQQKLGFLLNLLRVLTAIFEPFIPSLCAQIYFLLNFNDHQGSYGMLKKLRSKEPESFLGFFKNGHTIRQPVILVSRIDSVEKYIQKYGGAQA